MGLLDWLQDPRRTQAMQGIGSAIQSGLLNIQQGNERFQGLASRALADPMNPAKVTDPQAFNELSKMAMGLLSFAPVGIVKQFDFQKSVRDASEIFGEGSKRIKYTEPNSGGFIEVLQKQDGSASVLGLEVPEAFRGKGIGESLQSKVLNDFSEMQGQVSSKAAAKTAYRLGRRPPGQPDATLDDVYKLMDENSSVNLVSPEMQKRFVSLLD